MALENQATLTWNAVADSDLSHYLVYKSQVSGTWGTGAANVGTSSGLMNAAFFNNDGLWYFTVSAVDTSINESAKATPVSKRIIRTSSQFIVRR